MTENQRLLILMVALFYAGAVIGVAILAVIL